MNKLLNIFAIALVLPLIIGVGLASAQVTISDYSIDGGAGISSGGNFTITGTIGQPDSGAASSGGNFTVTGGFESPDSILLGDVNGDGEVNLLDVAPFVDALSTGTYIPEADVNQDGSVDLLDVAPFIELLSG